MIIKNVEFKKISEKYVQRITSIEDKQLFSSENQLKVFFYNRKKYSA